VDESKDGECVVSQKEGHRSCGREGFESEEGAGGPCAERRPSARLLGRGKKKVATDAKPGWGHGRGTANNFGPYLRSIYAIERFNKGSGNCAHFSQ
jgi:hypothetical protein